jgi:hypothetical protein
MVASIISSRLAGSISAVSANTISHGGNYFRQHQARAQDLVPRHVPHDANRAISSLELGRRLGVTQTTAWELKHKLAQVMMERDATKRLVGLIEMDDAYLGGERAGGKRGRGSPGKTPIIVAVETTSEGQPVRLKMRRIKRLKRKRIKTLASRMLATETIVLTDGL